MRRARRVIVLHLILFTAAGIPAQQTTAPVEGSVDADVTVMGRDDSIIPIPEPEGGGDVLLLPSVDLDQPDSPPVPAVLPPLDDPTPPPKAEAPAAGSSLSLPK